MNENLKDLKIFKKTNEEIVKGATQGNNVVNTNTKGYYLLFENEIFKDQSSENKEYILFHELWHATFNLYIDDIKAFKSPTNGFLYGEALDEGIVNYLNNSICVDNCISYENQISNVEILVEIYGEEFIFEYLDKGILYVVYILSKDSSYEEANRFIKLMDKDLNQIASGQEIREIYKYLIDLYSKDISTKTVDSILNFQKLITNLDYTGSLKTINTENLAYMKKNYCLYEISDKIKYIVFNHDKKSKVYLLDKIYAIRIENNETYFVDTNIIKEYLKTGYIHNIYEDKTYYSEQPVIYSTTLFRDFIEDNLVDFIDVYENKIYINTDSLDYKLYDVEESVKVLIK